MTAARSLPAPRRARAGRRALALAAIAGVCAALAAGVSAGSPGRAAAGATAASVEQERPRPAGRVERIDHAAPDMVVVPAGRFRMGISPVEIESLLRACQVEFGAASAACEEDHNRKLLERVVHLDGFAIDRFEVTAAAYRRCVDAGGCSAAALVAGDERYIRDRWPMVNVTWQDAADYCAWAGKRLPTEAEWEKAARGTRALRWPWGDHARADGANHGACESDVIMLSRRSLGPVSGQPPLMFAPDDSDGHAYLTAPGTLRWGESPYGAHDMSGNASEWVQDYLGPEGYDDLPGFNPVRTRPHEHSYGMRVVRGGSWMEPAFFGRTYYRRWAPAGTRSERIGFRCARSLD